MGGILSSRQSDVSKHPDPSSVTTLCLNPCPRPARIPSGGRDLCPVRCGHLQGLAWGGIVHPMPGRKPGITWQHRPRQLHLFGDAPSSRVTCTQKLLALPGGLCGVCFSPWSSTQISNCFGHNSRRVRCPETALTPGHGVLPPVVACYGSPPSSPLTSSSRCKKALTLVVPRTRS